MIARCARVGANAPNGGEARSLTGVMDGEVEVIVLDVGGDPGRFGIDVERLHAANAERARRFPQNLLTTQTHDAKRSGEENRCEREIIFG